MRIVNRKRFLEMPAGTVYANFKPCLFSEIRIKGDTMDADFQCEDLSVPSLIGASGSNEWMDALFAMHDKGDHRDVKYDSMGRDGMFDEDQMFAVWEEKDHLALIVRLIEAYKEAFPGSGPPGFLSSR